MRRYTWCIPWVLMAALMVPAYVPGQSRISNPPVGVNSSSAADVTASRSHGTDYQNTSGRPMLLVIDVVQIANGAANAGIVSDPTPAPITTYADFVHTGDSPVNI